MAFSTICIAIAHLVAVFDITHAIDKNGDILPAKHEYESALVL
jgi:hypothetical protein